MAEKKSALRDIVLAGGEKSRLKRFIQEYFGTDVPKQFCAFVWRRTMIEQAVRRAETIIPRKRLVVVATAHHRRYVFDAVTARPPGTILIQPANRETAPGIFCRWSVCCTAT